MSCASPPGFLHLNRDGLWPDFSTYGLESNGEGELQLQSLPLAPGGTTEEIEACPADGPAGIAIACDGTLFWIDPERGLVHRIPACEPRPDAALEAGTCDPSERGRPVALLILEKRRTLVVADAAGGRLNLYSRDTFQWLGSWGEPGGGDGQLDSPVALAADASGNVYVADAGNHRVQKFDRHGQVVPEFWQSATASAPALQNPVALVVSDVGGDEEVWVLDAAGVVYVMRADGALVREVALDVGAPLGLALDASGIYVGDNDTGQLLRFSVSGLLIGAAFGYSGPIAGLAIAGEELWLMPGCGLPPMVLTLRGAFVGSGLLWGGPFGDGKRPRSWQRLHPVGAGFDSENLHVRWFVYGSENAVPPPDPDPASADPFDADSWQALAPDAPDVWLGQEATHLWLGATIESDGLVSPLLSNLRVDFNRAGYVQHLPAIYQTRTNDLDGLERFLGLFESLFVDAESEIGSLERLFDPEVVPEEWLDWLAGWLVVELDQSWPDEEKRRAIAEAWDRHRWRGTARGLRSALRLYSGVDALVEEPLLQSSWWALAPEDDANSSAAEVSVLGFTTMLAASEPAGALLGSSAVLDQSQLITGEDYGAPLFEATAHQFSVRLFARQLSGIDQLDSIKEVIERAKPAHTLYHVCVVEPRLRVGYQARLGVDSIIGGGPAEPSSLGVDAPESGGLILGGEPAGRLGRESRLGTRTWLGAQPVETGTECQSPERRDHGYEG